MSTAIETLNRGQVEDFGYVYGDTERVRLGALPAIPIEQFAEYSTDCLIEIVSSEKTPHLLSENIKLAMAFACGRINQAKINEQNERMRSGENPNAELMRNIMRNISPQMARSVAMPEASYQKNPFTLHDAKIIISNFYEVDVEEFSVFAVQTLGGGIFGWTSGVPESIKKNATRIMHVLTQPPKSQ